MPEPRAGFGAELPTSAFAIMADIEKAQKKPRHTSKGKCLCKDRCPYTRSASVAPAGLRRSNLKSARSAQGSRRRVLQECPAHGTHTAWLLSRAADSYW